MRTIKFRAWDSLHKVYRDHQDLQTIKAVIFGNDYDGRVVVEQFTGLLDKNGKEIYEGDLVSSPHIVQKGAEIRWENFGWSLGSCWPLAEYEDTHDGIDDLVVIGNIHEASK